MKEVFPNLFVGKQDDFYNMADKTGWSFVHAAREPFHRKAVGYKGNAAPKGAEYLVARRGNELNLNLLDADNPKYIPDELIEKALAFMKERLDAGDKLLCHCNQGGSRGPALALMYMHRHEMLPADPALAWSEFIKLYPAFLPNKGMLAYTAAKLKAKEEVQDHE